MPRWKVMLAGASCVALLAVGLLFLTTVVRVLLSEATMSAGGLVLVGSAAGLLLGGSATLMVALNRNRRGRAFVGWGMMLLGSLLPTSLLLIPALVALLAQPAVLATPR